jgi:hypothetical protein
MYVFVYLNSVSLVEKSAEMVAFRRLQRELNCPFVKFGTHFRARLEIISSPISSTSYVSSRRTYFLGPACRNGATTLDVLPAIYTVDGRTKRLFSEFE